MKTAFFHYKRPYLPQIPRFITVSIGFLFTIGMLSSGLWLFHNLKPSVHVYAKKSVKEGQLTTQDLQKSYDWWKKTIARQPEYLDGYIMASYYAKLLGKRDEALSLLHRALTIDPNNETIHTLQEQEKMGVEE